MKMLNEVSLSFAGYLLLAWACFLGGSAAADSYDVYLLAGQSNMDGRGKASDLTPTQSGPFTDVTIYYRNKKQSSEGWKPLTPGFSVPPKYKGELPSPTFGPELGFAREMVNANQGQKIALIKGSRGGTSLRVDWNPGEPGKPETQGECFRSFCQTIRMATDALTKQGHRFQIRGLLWHQGEADKNLPSAKYEQRFHELISRIEKEVGVEDLPVVVGEVFNNGKRDKVRAALQAIGKSGPSFGLVSSDGTTTSDEGTHFDSASQILLGQRYAAEMVKLQRPANQAGSSDLSVVSFANGIKVGEVSPNHAIVWARLCAVATAHPTSTDAAAPGTSGSVELRFWPDGKTEDAVTLDPVKVDDAKDFTCQISVSGLLPSTLYHVETTAFSPSGDRGERMVGRFKTAPMADEIANVTAVVVTGQGHESTDDPKLGHWSYKDMLRHDPDFFIHTGDIIYYDKPKAQPLSTSVVKARQRWNRMFAYQWNQDFHNKVTSYFIKDDHDTLKNDCWPGQTYGELTWSDGLALYREQTPQGELPYRSRRWGMDLEIWLIEGRDYRSSNTDPDGPQKTILGDIQKGWLKDSIKKSDATFKLAVFPSPVVGPDKSGKSDNHSNPGFQHEGDEIRAFLSSVPNTFVVCGDRHWQYASKDPKTGLVEICCGPINNEHAKIGGNVDQDGRYHLYYGGGLGGYLKITVSRRDHVPMLKFIWHGDQSSNGKINHQLEFSAQR